MRPPENDFDDEPCDLIGVRPSSPTLMELHGLVTLLLADLGASERTFTRLEVSRAATQPVRITRTLDGLVIREDSGS